MIVAAWVLLVPFGLVSLFCWIALFFGGKEVELSKEGAFTTLVSTLITAISAGVIWG